MSDELFAIIVLVLGLTIIGMVLIMTIGCVSVEVTHYTTVIATDNTTTVEGTYGTDTHR